MRQHVMHGACLGCTFQQARSAHLDHPSAAPRPSCLPHPPTHLIQIESMEGRKLWMKAIVRWAAGGCQAGREWPIGKHSVVLPLHNRSPVVKAAADADAD